MKMNKMLVYSVRYLTWFEETLNKVIFQCFSVSTRTILILYKTSKKLMLTTEPELFLLKRRLVNLYIQYGAIDLLGLMINKH